MNKWNVPEWLEREVRDRDTQCVYCCVAFDSRDAPTNSAATWEHIINDVTIVTRENIARCCLSCNSSKGTKRLEDWLQSDYCTRRGITADAVAEVVKRVLAGHG